jgi:hypothetical protein
VNIDIVSDARKKTKGRSGPKARRVSSDFGLASGQIPGPNNIGDRPDYLSLQHEVLHDEVGES